MREQRRDKRVQEGAVWPLASSWLGSPVCDMELAGGKLRLIVRHWNGRLLREWHTEYTFHRKTLLLMLSLWSDHGLFCMFGFGMDSFIEVKVN